MLLLDKTQPEKRIFGRCEATNGLQTAVTIPL